MQPWTKVVDPFGNIWLSALVAALPIFVLGYLLAVRKMKGYLAALITIVIATLIGIFMYGIPYNNSVGAVLAMDFLGAFKGLFPIFYVVLFGVFLYNLTVEAGQFEIIKWSIGKVSDDQRIQAILIAFCFSAFIEGAAGFGTPVAIAAAMMIGMGFPPVYAAGLALVANSVPVAYGSIGIPITTAGSVTGLDPNLIGAMAGRQLPILTLIVPLWVVMIMGGWKAAKGVLPAAIVAGVSFAAAQFISSNYFSYQITDLAASFSSIIAMAILLVFWKPKDKWTFEGAQVQLASDKKYTAGQVAVAWSPYVITMIVIFIWSEKWFKDLFPASKAGQAAPWYEIKFAVPGLYAKTGDTVSNVVHSINWFTASGTAILVATLLSALVLIAFANFSFARYLKTFGNTCKQLALPALSVACFLAYAELSTRTGMGETLGKALSSTGVLFAFFAPIIGFIGVFLTGSDTSTNALFGKLQQVAAKEVGISDILAVSSNSTGGCAAKMISPQSIAVGAGATNQAGQEGNILRFTFKHSLIFVGLMGVISWLQAYVFPWMVPTP
ncbi:L-lactate permease [Effusibacillus lacus]|uniref:L-lactate permease n=1 Tax=Effusibacillus lacus TaxID=1348429 RepID=A0A292YL67_9BACL|nr:lactate permease LctP family transporter [Effusibacillus lacus]TCS73605.1 lactate permease [Effusibacillus lacus]GAX89503.1 lactate permease [Effusibacillus lacus]